MELKRKFFHLNNLILSILLLSANSGVFAAPISSNDELNKLLGTTKVRDTITVGSLKESVLCEACTYGVNLIQKLLQLQTSEKLIVEAAIKVCKLFKIEDDYVCENIVPEFKVL